MKQKISNRSLRAVLSSLLASNLSDLELLEVAEDMLHGGEVCRRASSLLKAILGGADSASRFHRLEKPQEKSEETGNPLVDEAIRIVKRRRLSKVAVLNAIGVLNPDAKSAFLDRMQLSISEILREFCGREPRDKMFAFLEILDGGFKPDDEYLKGIMRAKTKPDIDLKGLL
jgi:hypothetical protein